MNTTTKYAFRTIVTIVILIIASFLLLNRNELVPVSNVLTPKFLDFLGNLLLNVVAELVGFAVALTIGIRMAKNIAKESLEKLAPKLVSLIGHLRAGGTINKEAARECVRCAVQLISEDSLKEMRSREDGNAAASEKCIICDLNYQTTENGMACSYCKLSGKVWDDEELIEAIKNSSKVRDNKELIEAIKNSSKPQKRKSNTKI